MSETQLVALGNDLITINVACHCIHMRWI
jgi:hypothetical protein